MRKLFLCLFLVLLSSNPAFAQDKVLLTCTNLQGYSYYFDNKDGFVKDKSSDLVINLITKDDKNFDIVTSQGTTKNESVQDFDKAELILYAQDEGRVLFQLIPTKNSENKSIITSYLFDFKNLSLITATYRLGFLPKANILKADCKISK